MKQEKLSHKEKLDLAMGVFNRINPLLKWISFLQNAVLWLSVITSGAMRLLLTNALPRAALWGGAIISSFAHRNNNLPVSRRNKKKA